MPKSCEECPMSYMWEHDNSTSCRLKFGLWNEEYKTTRHKECPLKERVFQGKESYRESKYKILQQATGKSGSKSNKR